MADQIMLYIDPGTGSMLFTIMISIVGFLIYLFKVAWVKIKFIFTRGKQSKVDSNKIPYLIFAEAKRYWEVFKPFCDEFEKRGIDVVYWTTSPDDPALEQKYEHIKFEFVGEGNKAYARLNMVNACIVIASTPGLNVYQWKRSKFVDHYCHVQHAANDIAGYRMFGTDYFDSILLSGQYQIDEVRELEKKRNLPAKDLALVGIPYMDDMRAKIASLPKPEKENRTILLAPSWGPNSIFNKYGTSVLEELMKTGYDIIVRPHPQSFIADPGMVEGIMEKFPAGDHLKWDRNPDNFESLFNADVLISDFSGIIFDFTLAFDKPILYADTSFDPGCYDYYWLDEQPWTLRILPFLGKQLTGDNLTEIRDLVDTVLTDPYYKEGRDKARSETWVYMGEGTVRTIDFIVNKYKEITSEKEKAVKKPEKNTSKKVEKKK